MSADAAGPARERYDRARALFLAAARLARGERDAFVEREAAGDAALAAEVRALLAHDGADEAFIARPALAAAESLVSTPRRIGKYLVRAKIGEGGMGSVFEAVQESPPRVVAVKVLHPSVATDATRQRFEREARLLARLHHPGIAQIHEAGEAETDFGRQPYFVMERVEGLPLTEHARRNGLGTADSLELFARVCDAVQHAHDRGVVHRDLKPANVLVDASGQPKVLDFGIARLLEHDGPRVTSALTGEDLILGTVPYLSPEQASGRAREIDGRADVYSLGVVLYELLTGDLPFDVRARPAAEALRIVLDRDPTPPGTRSREFRGDLDTIVGKAMEKERERRYATPSALAADVRRHLRSEPIAARPPSALYRAREFARRNRALVAGGLTTIGALAAGGAVAWELALDERAARERADWNAYRSGVLLAASALAAADVVAARAALEAAPERHRGFEWRHIARALDGGLATIDAAGEPRGVEALAFSADGSRLFLGTTGAGLRVVDVASAGGVATPVGASGERESVHALGPRADGFVASGGSAPLRILSAAGGVRSTSAAASERADLGGCALSPDGTRVALWSDELHFELFDTSGPDWRLVARFDATRTWRSRSAFAPDGSLLAIGSSGGTVLVVDAASGAERAVFRERDQTSGLAFSPDGARLAVGYGPEYASPDAGVSVHDLAGGDPVRHLPFAAGPVQGLAFAPDGARLAIGTSWGSVHVLDATSGERTATHRSRGSVVVALAYSTDGTLLAAGTNDGVVTLFPAERESDEASVLRGHESYAYACAFSPDGKTIASGAWDDTLRLWDAASGTELAVLRGHADYVNGVEFDASGAQLLSTSGDRSCRLWDVRTGRETARHAGENFIAEAAFLPDGRLLVATDDVDARVSVRDARSGEIAAALAEPAMPIGAVALAPDGREVAGGASDGSVRVYALPSFALARASAPTGSAVTSVAYSTDGSRVAVARIDGSVEALDARTLASEWLLPLSGGETFVVQFSPGGERVAAGGRDGLVRIVDSASGEIVASLRGHGDYVYDLDWSPDGSALVSASGDRTLRVWDTAPAGERLRARLAAERARAAVEPRVRALWAELGDEEAVAARIAADAGFGPEERAAALREALRQRP